MVDIRIHRLEPSRGETVAARDCMGWSGGRQRLAQVCVPGGRMDLRMWGSPREIVADCARVFADPPGSIMVCNEVGTNGGMLFPAVLCFR